MYHANTVYKYNKVQSLTKHRYKCPISWSKITVRMGELPHTSYVMVQSLTNEVTSYARCAERLDWVGQSGSQCDWLWYLMEELYNTLYSLISLCSTVTCCYYYKVWFCWKAMKDNQILKTSVYRQPRHGCKLRKVVDHGKDESSNDYS